MTAWQRFGRFNSVGALGIGVQLVTIWVLTQAGVHYLPATVLAVGAAVGHNFLWHRRWTWADRTAADPLGLRSFLAFAAANGLVSLAGNVVFMAMLVGAAGLPVVAANVVSIGLCGLLNFWLGDRVVFV